MTLKSIAIAFLTVLVLGACKNPKANLTQSQTETTNTNSVDSVAIQKTQSPAYGIDISHYQGDEVSNLFKSKDSLSFVICKATEGTTYVDPEFYYNWSTIEEHGFIKGAYHFYLISDSPETQASFFVKTISSLKLTDIPPIVDFEQASINVNQSTDEIQANLKTFLNAVASALNCTPIIYTNPSAANTYLKDAYFSNYPLWIADHTSDDVPELPITWQEVGWKIWQKSDTYEIDGTVNDFDIFNGNISDLRAFIKSGYR